MTIRKASDAQQDIAVFKNNTWTSGGTLELPDGRHLRASTNFWQSAYTFASPTDEVLVRYHGLMGMPFTKARVRIEPAGAALPELSWLVPLGFYLALMMQFDASAAGAGGTGG